MNNPAFRSHWSWAFYDWANSAFATAVMAGFFPVFFKQYWNTGVSATESTFRLGVANSTASLIVVFLSPLLGAVADRLERRKALLLLFTSLGVVMTGALYFVAEGQWALAVLLYVCGVLGFSGGNLFYDSLLVFVAQPRDYDRLSARGFALGYLGGGLLFACNVLVVQKPHWFGLDDPAQAVRLAFLSVAIWWAVFSIPLFLFVEEPREPRASRLALHGILVDLQRLAQTIRDIGKLPHTFLFLIAYWIYIDGVDTIIRMAVDYGLALGFPANGLILALLVTQFVGFPATLLFGRLGNRIGVKRGILLALGVYVLVTLGGAAMNQAYQFYVLAVAIGLVQGGVQALSRSLYARLIPHARAAEFFGFYNMVGKFAAVVGPALMGWIAIMTQSNRLSILSVLVLFVVGMVLLLKVNINAGVAAAARA
jgi:UMF1 family MFS transporter